MQAETGIGEGRGIPVDAVWSGLGGEQKFAASAVSKCVSLTADTRPLTHSTAQNFPPRIEL
jgi:hypothetical protein